MLNGEQIYKEYINRRIYIDDFSNKRLNPNSYNLRLGDKITMYTGDVIDMKKDNDVKEIIIPDTGYILEPGKLYLMSTMEEFGTDHYVPMVEGRSSVGRLGINMFANFGDIGFHGYWTLNVSVQKHVRVYPFVEICQVYFLEVDETKRLYQRDGKYNHNKGAQASKLYMDFMK